MTQFEAEMSRLWEKVFILFCLLFSIYDTLAANVLPLVQESSARLKRASGDPNFLKYVTFPPDYNMNIAPSVVGGPVLVNVSANLKSILAIDEPNQVISIETTIRLSWLDPRIKVTLPEDQPENVPYLLFNR